MKVKCGNPACLINEAHSKLSRIQTQPKIVWRYLLHNFSESPINSEQTTPPNLQRGLQSDSQPEELTPIPPLNLSDTDTIFPNISTHQNSDQTLYVVRDRNRRQE
jgi:hypothetical protein